MSIKANNSLVPEGFIMGVHLAGVLGLESSYFTDAHRRGIDINAELTVIHDKFIYVKAPKEVMDKLAQGYICVKITKDEMAEFDYTYQLSRKCLIGMYK